MMFASHKRNQAKQPEGRSLERGGSTSDSKTASQLNPIWQSLAMRSGVLQPKLTVSQADDPYECEADRVADQVMRMPAPQSDGHGLSITPGDAHQARRKCAECEEEEGALQRKENGAAAEAPAIAPPEVHQTLSSPGRPLDRATRAYFESRFGADFSDVRVHTDARAVESTRAAHALAYTVGQDIAFATGQYAPHSETGRRLLAHELVHVVQGAPGVHAFSGEASAQETEADADAGQVAAFGDVSGEAPTPYEVFLSEAVYDHLTAEFTVDQVYPDLSFLEHEWPYDLGAFYDALSQHATFVNMAEADFSLLQPLALTEIEFYALRSMAALEDFLRFHDLLSRFLDPYGAFVEPATLGEYFGALTRPADRVVFGDAGQAIDSFRTRILAYVEPAYNLLSQLSSNGRMTLGGPISTFHAALFGLYVQTEDPMSQRSGGGAGALAMALEEYAGYEDSTKLAEILRQGFRNAYANAVASNAAVSMIAQAYGDRMGSVRPQPYQHPFMYIRPETVAFTNAILAYVSFDMATTLNAWQGPVSDRARGLAGFIDLLRSATTPETVYAIVQRFEGSAVDRTALYRNFLGIEPEWLDLAYKHRYILKDSGTYSYPAESPDPAISKAQWDLVTGLEEARSRRASDEFITSLLAMGASVAAGIVAGVISGGNPIAAAAAAGVVAAAFGASETLAAARQVEITGAANIAHETQDLPFGSKELADFAAEEYELTRQAAFANTLTAVATGGFGGPELGPGSRWIWRGLVSMTMGGFDGLASAVADPRIMDEDFARDKVVLMGGDPKSAPTAFEGVMYQVVISALFGVVADGVIEGIHFRVTGTGGDHPMVSQDGANVSGAEIKVQVGSDGKVGITGQGGEWSHETVSDLEQTLRRAQTDTRTTPGRGTGKENPAEVAPHSGPDTIPTEEPAPSVRTGEPEPNSPATAPLSGADPEASVASIPGKHDSEITPQMAENAEAYVNEHPELIRIDADGYQHAPIGKDVEHEIVEVPAPDMPSGVACEIHSDSGPRVPCPVLFKSYAVGHGAFNVVITKDGRVIIRDAGTEGTEETPDPGFTKDILDEFRKLIQGIDGQPVIHELSVSHLHADHFNLVGEIAKEFKIKKVVVNQLQQKNKLESYANLRGMLSPDTTLEILDPSKNLTGAPGPAPQPVSQDTEAFRSKWYVVPGSGKISGKAIDTHSTIYVDELGGARIVHMVDLRPEDIRMLKATNFHTDLSKDDAPPLTVWLLGHHFMEGFSGKQKREDKEALSAFLDQMIEYTSAKTAGGDTGKHIISTSLHVGGEEPTVNVQVVYLLQASGFDVRPLHGDQHLTIPREVGDEPVVPMGPEWTGPEPSGDSEHSLQKSFFAREELKNSVGENDPKYKMAELARKVYIEKILGELPKLEAIENVASDASLQHLIGDEAATQIEALGKIVAAPANEIIALTGAQLRARVEKIKEYIPKPPTTTRGLSAAQKEQNRSWRKLGEECDRIINSIPP